MIIKKIYIDEFGGLSGLRITPDKGINIIRGNNESGKSTLMSFISFIFYGLPSKRGEADRLEREKALSWTNGKASGLIEIEYNGNCYRIARCCIRSGPKDSVSEQRQIVDLTTGLEVYKDEQPGDVFLGVSQAVFESVTSVKQMGVGRISGSDLGGAVENILFSADETVSTERALKKLNAARTQLLPQRGGGGRIEELTRNRDIIKDRLLRAENSSVQIISLRAIVEKYRKVTAELRNKLDTARNACNAYDSYQILNRFDLLHAGENRIAGLKAEEEQLIRDYGTGGELPDRAYVEKLDMLLRHLGKSESELAVTGAEVRGLQSEQCGDSVKAAAAEDIAAGGGAASIVSEYRKKTGAFRGKIVLGVLFILLGILAAAASLTLYFDLINGLPLPKLPAGVSWGITLAGIAVIIAGGLILKSAKSAGKAASSVLSAYGFDGCGKPKRDCADFLSYAEECAKEKQQRDSWQKEFDALLTAFDSKKRETDSLRTECILELARFGYCRSPESVLAENKDEELPENTVRHKTNKAPMTDAEVFTAALSGRELSEVLIEAAGQASELVLKHEKLTSDIEKYSESVGATASALSGNNEAEMRARLSTEMIAALKEANPSSLKFERQSLEAQLDSANAKLNEAEKRLAVEEHVYDNPARLAVELEAAEDELDKAKRKCAAVMLAYKSISEAGDSLRKNVTPHLRRRAGEILSGLTGEKYSEIGVDNDFSVTVTTPAGTKPVSQLSGGTRDIVYFSLRLALAELIFPKSVPPLLLDEPAAQLDDSRATGLLCLLDKFAADGVQSIFFTCHTREAELLSSQGIDHSLTELK